MIGFLIKKAFFDFWDNMLKAAILNILFIPSIIVISMGIYTFIVGKALLFGALFFIPGIVMFIIHAGACSYIVKEYVNYKTPELSEYFAGLKASWKVNSLFAVVWAVFVLISFIGISYYLTLQSLPYMAAGAVLLWFTVTALLASMYFIPIRTRLGGGFKKVLKKCFLVSLDNPGVTIFMGILTLILTFLSGPLVFILPGPVAVITLHDTAFKLLLLKYDYLEENPDTNRKELPWQVILQSDSDNVGPRSVKGMIFPWKD